MGGGCGEEGMKRGRVQYGKRVRDGAQRGRNVKRKWFRKWRGSKTGNQGDRQRDGGTKRLDQS